MCDVETSLKYKIKTIATCSCGASYFDCKDDLAKALEHEEESMVKGYNHRWVFIDKDYEPPDK